LVGAGARTEVEEMKIKTKIKAGPTGCGAGCSSPALGSA
jgi:hypothetical protein